MNGQNATGLRPHDDNSGGYIVRLGKLNLRNPRASANVILAEGRLMEDMD